jgi:hypothetical protein
LELNTPIDLHAHEDMAFTGCCMFGHLEMAKWLYHLGKGCFNLKGAFMWSCSLNNLESVKWLHFLDHKLYFEEENGRIKNFNFID